MKTVEICGFQVSESFVELMETTAEMFNIELKGTFIPKFYHDVLKDEFAQSLILSEEKEGSVMKNAFKVHRQGSPYFPNPREIIMIINIMYGDWAR